MSLRVRTPALLTDLYELTMAAAYFETGLRADATFELFVRTLPPKRGYLLAAGLAQALDYLEELRFTSEQVDFLRRHPMFTTVSDDFFDYLKSFRFTGEVWAMPEGTLAFPSEPLMRVTGPIIEAQIVETFLLTTLTFQTMIATKAARVVEAAQGRRVVEFGTRRAHGPEAGVLAARAAFIGGCIGTSNTEAGFRFGIPSYGTVAHSFVMAYDEEEQSFRDFQKTFPENAILLVDTYDTLAAIDKIIAMGLKPKGVRLDSGDLVTLAKETRKRLDAAGLEETKIFASGDLSEYRIRDALEAGAPLDFFGVGTELATSKDAPALGGVYKLVEVIEGGQHQYKAKLAEEKVTYPGAKQVFRFRDPQGRYDHDIVGRANEEYPDADPLLTCVFRQGRRVGSSPSLENIQQRSQDSLRSLPDSYKRFEDPPEYPVRTSTKLDALLDTIRQKVLEAETKKNPR